MSSAQRPTKFPTLVALVAAALLLLLCPSYAWAQRVHVVAKGHTLGKIAARYHVSVQDLREVNALTSSVIRPGLKLVIPTTGKLEDAKKKAAQLREAHQVADGAREADAAAKKAQGAGARRARQYQKKPRRRGAVQFRHHGEEKTIRLVERGTVRKAALEQLSSLLRHRSGAQHPIAPALAERIATVSDHFGGRTLVVVSGYRPKTPGQFTQHSQHNVGKALDFRIEGVPNDVLRDFCLTLNDAGVGFYPNSGFVHLDARAKGHAWTDEARHGEAPKYVATAPIGARGGSKKTSSAPSQVANVKRGKQNTPGQSSRNTKANGHSRPTDAENVDNLDKSDKMDKSKRKKTLGKGAP